LYERGKICKADDSYAVDFVSDTRGGGR